MKSEEEAGHEHNINNMTQVDDYKSPWKDKDAKTVNDTAYTFLNSYDDEISDLDKIVEASKEPIKDTHVHGTSVGTTSDDSVVTGVGIIGRGGPRAISRGSITQIMILGAPSIISSNVIAHVLTDSSEMILKSDSFPCNHKRLRLKWVEGKRFALEDHLTGVRQDMCDDVAANYARCPVNHYLGDAFPANIPRSPSSNDSDSGDNWVHISGSN